jgi:hypothetical protein
VRLLDQREHRVVVQREHDDPADALGDPGVDLRDLGVELGVGMALQHGVAARLGVVLHTLEQQRVAGERGVRLGEGDGLVGRPAVDVGHRRADVAERERPDAGGAAQHDLAPAEAVRAVEFFGHVPLPLGLAFRAA